MNLRIQYQKSHDRKNFCRRNTYLKPRAQAPCYIGEDEICTRPKGEATVRDSPWEPGILQADHLRGLVALFRYLDRKALALCIEAASQTRYCSYPTSLNRNGDPIAAFFRDEPCIWRPIGKYQSLRCPMGRIHLSPEFSSWEGKQVLRRI